MQQHDESLRHIEHTARALARILGACIDGSDMQSAVDVIARSILELADSVVTASQPDEKIIQSASCAVAISGVHDPVFNPIKPNRKQETADPAANHHNNLNHTTTHTLSTSAVSPYAPEPPSAMVRLNRATVPTNTHNQTAPPTNPPAWSRCLTLGMVRGTPVGLAIQINGLQINNKDSDIIEIVLRHAGEALAQGPMTGALRRNALLAVIGRAQRKLIPHLLTDSTEQQIADKIHRSRHTVHDHVKLIYAAWGVNSRLGLCDVWFGRKPAPSKAGGVEIRTQIGPPTKLEH